MSWNPQNLKETKLSLLQAIEQYSRTISSLSIPQEQSMTDLSFLLTGAGAALLCVVLSSDPDPQIRREASHKANGAVSLFRLDKDPTSCIELFLQFLECTVSPLPPLPPFQSETSSIETQLCTFARNPLSEDLNETLLRWLSREMHGYLGTHSNSLIETCLRLLPAKLPSLQFQSTLLLNILFRNSSPTIPPSFLPRIWAALESSLQPLLRLLQSRSQSRGPPTQTDSELQLRKELYLLIEQSTTLWSNSSDVPFQSALSLVPILFQLLRLEDDSLSFSLHASLNSLRLACSKSEIYTQKGTLDPLLEDILALLSSSASSPDQKVRICAAQWARALFGIAPPSLLILSLLADDPHIDVRAASRAEFRALLSLVKGPDIPRLSIKEIEEEDIEDESPDQEDHEVHSPAPIPPPPSFEFQSLISSITHTLTHQAYISQLSRRTYSMIYLCSLLEYSLSSLLDPDSRTVRLVTPFHFFEEDLDQELSSECLTLVSDWLTPNHFIDPQHHQIRIQLLQTLSPLLDLMTSSISSPSELPPINALLRALWTIFLLRTGLSSEIETDFLDEARKHILPQLLSLLSNSVSFPPSMVRSLSQVAGLVFFLSPIDSVSMVLRNLQLKLSSDHHHRSKVLSFLASVSEAVMTHLETEFVNQVCTEAVSTFFEQTSLKLDFISTHTATITTIDTVPFLESISSLITRLSSLDPSRSRQIVPQHCLSQLLIRFKQSCNQFLTTSRQLGAIALPALIRTSIAVESLGDSWDLLQSFLLQPDQDLNICLAISECLRVISNHQNFFDLWNNQKMNVSTLAFTPSHGQSVFIPFYFSLTIQSFQQNRKLLSSVLILELVRNPLEMKRFLDSVSTTDSFKPTSRSILITLANLLLQLLTENSILIQNIVCRALCLLFSTAETLDLETNTPLGELLSLEISREVISVLLRERRQLSTESSNVLPLDQILSPTSEGAQTLSQLLQSGSLNLPQLSEILTEDSLQSMTGGLNSLLQPPSSEPASNPQASSLENGLKSEIFSTICKIARQSREPRVVFNLFQCIEWDSLSDDIKTLNSKFPFPKMKIEISNLKSIRPLIFLFRFDPSSSARDTFRRLWTLLYGNTPQIFTTSFKKEVSLLITYIPSRNWRERQAAASALEFVVTRSTWPLIRRYLTSLWTGGIALIDDIRETVREIGIGFMKALSSALIRSCDPSQFTTIRLQQNISVVVPLILNKGIDASNSEGRGFSFGILLKLIQTSRFALKSWLPDLISVLVESMSALEPRSLQYLQFHTSRLNMSEEELEALRIKMSQNSPIQEALSSCLQAVEPHSPIIPKIMSSLTMQLQRGVGLATRVSASQSISQLIELHASDVAPCSNQAFGLVLNILLGDSYLPQSTIKSFISCLSSLSKVLPAAELSSYCQQLVIRYQNLGRDEDGIGQLLVTCLEQMLRQVNDRLLGDEMWPSLVSCSFIGTHDLEASSQEIWVRVWNLVLLESGLATKSNALHQTLLMVLGEISALIGGMSWIRRRQGARALNDIIDVLPSDQTSPNIGIIVELLIKSIPGKYWVGKGELILGLSNLLNTSTQSHLSFDRPPNDLFVLEDESNNSQVTITLNQILGPPSSTSVEIDPLDVPISEVSTDRSIQDQARYCRWSVSILGIVNLFLDQFQKSQETEYKIQVSRAISNLPFSRLEAQIPQTFDLLHRFVELASISSNIPLHQSPSNVLPQAPMKKHKTIASASSIFGSRYGTLSSAPVKKSVQQLTQSSRASSLSNISNQNNPPSFSDGTLLNEPAIRLQFLECLRVLWPKPFPSTAEYEDLRLRVVSWACRFSGTGDVWTLRVSAFQLIQRISRDDTFRFPEVHFRECLASILCSSQETRYSKIRLAAITTLDSFVSTFSRNEGDPMGRSNVEEILRIAACDSDSSIRDLALRVRIKWNNFIHSMNNSNLEGTGDI